MAAYTTTEFELPASPRTATKSTVPTPTVRPARRHITPQAGRALEILGHAIDYLTDELVHERAYLFAKSGQMEAVQLLMAANRQVYYACPVALSLCDRFRAWLRLHTA